MHIAYEALQPENLSRRLEMFPKDWHCPGGYEHMLGRKVAPRRDFEWKDAPDPAWMSLCEVKAPSVRVQEAILSGWQSCP